MDKLMSLAINLDQLEQDSRLHDTSSSCLHYPCPNPNGGPNLAFQYNHCWSNHCSSVCFQVLVLSTSVESPLTPTIYNILPEHRDLHEVFNKTKATLLPTQQPWDCIRDLHVEKTTLSQPQKPKNIVTVHVGKKKENCNVAAAAEEQQKHTVPVVVEP